MEGRPRMIRFLPTFLVVWLAGTSAVSAQSEWDKVIAAAKQEGSVVLYTALGGPFQEAPIKAFQQRYGIKVEEFRGRASEVRERARIEVATGRVAGDIYQGSDASFAQLNALGLLDPVREVPAMTTLLPSIAKDGLGVPIALYPYAILVNTRLVRDDEIRSWKDLLEPKWAGKILSDDLRVYGSGLALFETTYTAFGRAFHEGLAAQKPSITRANREAEQRVARGEYAMFLPQMFPYALRLKGLPVRLAIPDEGAVYALSELGQIKGAPHPNAARLLMNHFLSEEAQLNFANAGLRPVVAGIAEKADAAVQPLMKAKLLGTYTAEGQDRMPPIAAEIYK